MNFKTLLAVSTLILSNYSFAQSVSWDKLSNIVNDNEKKYSYDHLPERSEVVERLNILTRKIGGIDRVEELAARNDADSMYILGQMYRLGIVYDVDKELSLKYLTQSSERNSADASFILGLIFLKGDHQLNSEIDRMSIEERYFEAFRLINKASELGNLEAQFELAKLYLSGYGHPRDYDLGMYWLSQSSDKGNRKASDLRNAISFSLKKLEAFDHIKYRAGMGDREYLFKLGMAYYEGVQVNKDDVKALRLFETASKQGNAEATEMVKRLK